MAETLNTLADLKNATDGAETATTSAAPSAPREPKKDGFGRAYATGRRKESTARVWLKPGRGKIMVNGKEQEKYFGRPTHLLVINQPFLIANRVNSFDVVCTVSGGGLSGQAGAIRHGISRALQNYEPDLRSPLKAAGMLTRDARTVERKKVGKHGARRSKQWVKR